MVDKIAQNLNLTPIDEFEDNSYTTNKITYVDRGRGEASLQTVQDGLLHIIDVGQQAMEKLAVIADQSEMAGDFEALTKIMKELRETNKDLLEIQKTQLEIEKRRHGGSTTQKPEIKTIFSGSSKEALDKIKKTREITDDTE